ncbi:hypothetical protein [Burkholderia gladioli]|uniref:Holin n=1 Tax=Burkholderia gladioli TaxID=28095 RepID=A0A2A7S925_BURGA|nr:hypothetical protein [Burkholderia gladioli]MCH7272595.1 hypothetical protein [Burkholderia gladioli]MDC6133056.1 hypothetical protein [Burkholderia gladioli]MDN8061544.1 hypothetical protein [Burkholderia gladioli]MEB2548981.1 hypothetical protein [Burkholderia gladioli]PEH40167.1 hypothetical protein CRM94_22265 [Burkholderia gladioli]
MKIRLVEDWKEAWKWSEMRLLAAGAAVLAAMPHLFSLLSDNWPSVAPWVMTYFPKAPATIVPVIGLVITMIARVLEVSRHDQ